MSDLVLLTGISGFLGSHVALHLLNAGYTVRGSVRNLNKADKVRETLNAAGADISKLEFVALDLLKDEGWGVAMKGCKYLIHTASPVLTQMPDDPDVLIRPAVEGTKRAINAALKEGVERIVLTSSTQAITDGHDNYSRPFNASDWTNTKSANCSAYAKSKTLAEQEAWSIVDTVGRRNCLAVINPGAILGPLLDERGNAFSVLIKKMLDGSMPACPQLYFPLIDIRDVAALHVDALTNPNTGGQRCIAAVETLSVSELGKLLKKSFPSRRVPVGNLPNWLVRIIGRFDKDIKDVLPEIGKIKHVDGSLGAEQLGRPLISIEQAAMETGKSLERFGHI